MLAQVFRFCQYKIRATKNDGFNEKRYTFAKPETFFVNLQLFSFPTCGQSCGQTCGQIVKVVVKVVVKMSKLWSNLWSKMWSPVSKVVILSKPFCSAILFTMRTKIFIKNLGKGLKNYELIKR